MLSYDGEVLKMENTRTFRASVEKAVRQCCQGRLGGKQNFLEEHGESLGRTLLLMVYLCVLRTIA